MLPGWRLVRLLALLPPFAVAFWALTLPWARARVVGFWGLTRSPEAALLVAVALGIALAGGLAAAWTGRRQRLAGWLHLATGAALAGVAWQAYRIVRDAGVSALFIPIASVKPGRGLYLFAAAAVWLLVLGALELGLDRRARRGRRAPRTPDPAAG
jgi:hypothetical protein